MSDILSGGAIDETTSGPIPASQDNRSLDIIAETAAKQERDAIGGSQNPPTVEAPPPIPQPPEVAPPPLPDIDIPQLGIDFGPAAEATREIARQATVDVLKRVTINGQSPIIEGSSISFNTESKSIFDENFGTMGNTNFLQPMYGNPLNSPDFGTRAGMEERSVAEGFARAEERRRARVEAQPDFDRESDQRQRGESASQFRERQEILRIERKEAEKQEKLLQRAREGDVSELPSGMVPVRLTRADGQKKILALMATELVGVVDGAVVGERTIPLPAKDSYYEGGGGGETPSHPWKITIRTVPESDPPLYQYAIESASRLFNGYGGSQIVVNGADGVFRSVAEGFYFIEVSFDGNGEPNMAEITINASLGSIIQTSGTPPVQTKLRQQIGYVFLEDGVPILRQNAWHNYTLFDTCRNGAPIKVTIAT